MIISCVLSLLLFRHVFRPAVGPFFSLTTEAAWSVIASLPDYLGYETPPLLRFQVGTRSPCNAGGRRTIAINRR